MSRLFSACNQERKHLAETRNFVESENKKEKFKKSRRKTNELCPNEMFRTKFPSARSKDHEEILQHRSADIQDRTDIQWTVFSKAKVNKDIEMVDRCFECRTKTVGFCDRGNFSKT